MSADLKTGFAAEVGVGTPDAKDAVQVKKVEPKGSDESRETMLRIARLRGYVREHADRVRPTKFRARSSKSFNF